jgi:hypothetical protein
LNYYFYSLFRNFFLVHYHPLQPPEPEKITICNSHINFFSFSHFSLPKTIQAKTQNSSFFPILLFLFLKNQNEKEQPIT